MTDEELMLAVCEGDQSSYQTLVRQHLKPISHYAYRILGSNRDAEDITQEVFLRMWVNAAKWNPEKSKLTTWLHRIAHNLCIDYLRKHGNTETREDIEEGLYETGSQENNIEDIGQTQLSSLLDQAIQRLPENQRSALMLCHHAGFSNKEAADIMNISVKAVESNIARARRNLRSWLEQNRDIEELRGETENFG